MARTQANLNSCMITQDLNVAHLMSWNAQEQDAIIQKNATGIATVIYNRLCSAGMTVAEVHCIIHDKDTEKDWDSDTVTQKLEHFHAVVLFAKDDKGKTKGKTLDEIANAVGVESQYIEKPRAGKFSYDNLIAYLIHAKDTSKHQYDANEVATVPAAARTYQSYVDERYKAWVDARAKVKTKKAKMDIDKIEEYILLGQMSKTQILLSDELYAVYARNKRRCDDAFDTYMQRKIAITCKLMDDGKFKKSVFFITGASHAGKSMFTDMLVKKLKEDAKTRLGQTWTSCAVGAEHPFDEYLGDEVLVMDDLRGMSLTASDWLKLMDPDRINVGSSRYHNKRMAVRVIIINSEKDITEFFYYLKGTGGGDRSEALDQFYRRILSYCKVYRVPEDFNTRRVKIGDMQETPQYYVRAPRDGSVGSWLELNHDFNANTEDLTCEQAVARLSNSVMARNDVTSNDDKVVIDNDDDAASVMQKSYEYYNDMSDDELLYQVELCEHNIQAFEEQNGDFASMADGWKSQLNIIKMIQSERKEQADGSV